MNNLQDLIDTATRLCKTLEDAANLESQFCVDIQMRLEQMSWESLRMADELNEIKSWVG